MDEKWERIIGNGIHFAPLAGVADPPVRVLARLFGAGPLMTEMISAHGVAAGRKGLIQEQLVLKHLESPLAVQLVGSDPEIMADVARLAQGMGADSININMACPARKIVKSGKGCGMMLQPELSAAVMTAVRAAVAVPVTLKIRAGWNASSINCVDFSRMAEDCGMDSVILHPRTRAQGFSGEADWSLIERVVKAVSIPVVGNGDVRTCDDASRMLETTGCSAIMIGRGALGKPWLFAQVANLLQKTGANSRVEGAIMPHVEGAQACSFDVSLLEAGDPVEVGRLVRLHIELAAGVRPQSVFAKEVRKHLIWYSKGMPFASRFRANIHTAVDRAALDRLVDEFFVR